MRVAVLDYDSDNLGDWIQSIAATVLCKDLFGDVEIVKIQRRKLREVPKDTLLICNGFFDTNQVGQWPPPDNSIVIGAHIAKQLMPSLKGRRIGCRDLATLKHSDNGYFSGCLTLSLRSEVASRDQGIVAVDDSSFQASLGGITTVSHYYSGTDDPWCQANSRLLLYQRADLVITSRLHATIPCLAYGTPVMCRPTQGRPRFSGLELMRDQKEDIRMLHKQELTRLAG